ncbi:YbbR-like domain-containing protein [Lacticaseibacillus kribbianus]|uniref:CdaR family protein n=1 Tax=Lacticaseibacillus kribbianus TaxID=2926292 RepID=UPI001CD4012B|nr:CdaR family protein [Lacticaseibacillus kribbianus]
MKLSKFWESAWFYRLLALLLAVGLFAYVHAEDLNNLTPSTSRHNAISATTKRTLNVTLQLNADTDKYFITGFPKKVAITLEGSNSLVTMTANTLNFQVIANLRKLGPGKHTVALTTSGLNKDLTYTLKPKTIQVTIRDRKTKTMPIQVKYNQDSLAPGYTADTPQLSAETVSVTGSKGEIDRVAQIVANLPLNRNTKSTVSQTVLLQALDKSGNTVNVVMTPETVQVKLPIALPSKKVPLALSQEGKGTSGLAYTLSTTTKSVTLYGPKEILAKLDKLVVPVAVADIGQTTTKTIALLDVEPKLIATAPTTVKVKVTVAPTVSSGEVTSPASSSSSSSSSSDATASSSASSSTTSSSEDAD